MPGGGERGGLRSRSRARDLDWDGCWNVRDLGGLRTAGGRETRWGAVVRADAVDRLTATGWSALRAHGVRTIIDLRNDDERRPDIAPRPRTLTTLHLPLDGVEDTAFWTDWARQAPPLYYGPHLDRFPQRSAGVLAAIARAAPGGVLIHCVGGRDRTGLVALLLLALVGVGPEDIADDHALSGARLAPFFAAHPEREDQGRAIAGALARAGTSARAVVLSTVESLDAEERLRAGGLGDDELGSVRGRLLGRGSRTSSAARGAPPA